MADAVQPSAGTHDPHAGHDDHHGHVAHHFETAEQQFDSSKLGMWLFLATEILLFGGLFCAYAVWRANHPDIFVAGQHHLDWKLGALNTVILLLSSFTMAWAVTCSQKGNQAGLKLGLALTLVGGLGFMVIKTIEYSHKIHEGLLWGKAYNPNAHHSDDAHDAEGESHGEDADHGAASDGESAAIFGNPVAAASLETPEENENAAAGDDKTDEAHADHGADHAHADADEISLQNLEMAKAPPSVGPIESGVYMPLGVADEEEIKRLEMEPTKILAAANAPEGLAPLKEPEQADPKAIRTYFSIYFCMTGLHGAHVLIGMAVIAWLLWRANRGDFSAEYFTPVDLGGLYWHLVDLIWIYLFPLLYLIG